MIAYKIDDKIYINLTNKCSNNCAFCVRTTSNFYEEYDLWLKKEPTKEEAISALKPYLSEFDDYVFCGYGEPLYAFDVLLEVGKFLKSQGKRVRLNTNGQADLIVGAGASEKLKTAVDEVSISLNASNAEAYDEICRCKFGKKGYDAMLKFAAECKKSGLKVVFSIVRTGNVDVDGCEKIASTLGIPLRIRELIE